MEEAIKETIERTAGLLLEKKNLIYWVHSKDANYIVPRCTCGGCFLYNHAELWF